MSTRNDRPELDRDEVELVRRIAEEYTPAPMSPAERVAFHERLSARLAGRGPRWLLASGLAATAAAAVVLWLATAPSLDPPAQLLTTAQWESELLYPVELVGEDAAEAEDEESLLPADYQEIALLLDG